jgi:poly(A) polymerase
MEDRRFRAAYDFLCLRSTIDERLKQSAAWWTKVQTLPDNERENAAANRPVVHEIWPSESGSEQSSYEGSDQSFSKKKGSAKKKPRRRRRRKPAGDKSNTPKAP